MQNDQIAEQAQRHVRAIRGFYYNLVTYLFVNILLFIVDYITSPGDWWFYWVSLGWGFGLIIQAWSVFGKSQMFGSEWEKKKIQDYIDRNEKK